MSFDDLVKKLPFIKQVNSVLVCEVNHLSFKAAVIMRQADKLVIKHEFILAMDEQNNVVKQTITKLRQQGWLGNNAILLSPAVLSALVDLPIPHKNKLSPSQISESIRWEIEPLISQHQKILAIGRILISQGLLTETQVDDILNQQSYANNKRSKNIAEPFSYKRFGEIAIEMGLINQSQLETCLGRYQTTGEDIKCGWSVQAVAPKKSENNQHQWLTSAVNESILRQWQASFAAHNIQLTYLYPLTGCASGTLTLNNQSAKPQLLLELHDCVLSATQLRANHIHALHSHANAAGNTLNNCAEIYHLLDSAEFETIWLANSSTNNALEASNFADNLAQVLQHPVKTLINPSELVTLGMLGAARNFMKMKGAELIAGIPVKEAQPPLLQRVKVRAVLAAISLLLGLAVAEGVLQIRQSLIELANKNISEDVNKVDNAIARLNTKADKVKQLKELIKVKSEDTKEIQSTVNLLTIDIPKRNILVNTLLNDMSRSVSADVVIDRLSEDPMFGFSIQAWSLNEKSAQEFVKYFQLAVHALGLKIKDVTVSQQTGRLGLIGYSVKFNATNLDDDAWLKAKQYPNTFSPAKVNSLSEKQAIPVETLKTSVASQPAEISQAAEIKP